MRYSDHYKKDRQARDAVIQKIGMGIKLKSFIRDNGHEKGLERHIVTSTALILIYNKRTNKLITILIARPNQIRRLYNDVGLPAPMELLDLAYEHEKLGYHRI